MIPISPKLEAFLRTPTTRVCVITGAGVSSESGIPTFRGKEGYWKTFSPEVLASRDGFSQNPQLVWEWYLHRQKICSEAMPNPSHDTIAKMEQFFPNFLLVTQNVDGLHKKAGSQKFVEIHGNLHISKSFEVCQKQCRFPIDSSVQESFAKGEIPHCKDCKKILRPNVVWFGETYDQTKLEKCFAFLETADLVLVAGTSGLVPIPVYLATHAKKHGAFVVELNTEMSELTKIADEFLEGKCGSTFPELFR